LQKFFGTQRFVISEGLSPNQGHSQKSKRAATAGRSHRRTSGGKAETVPALTFWGEAGYSGKQAAREDLALLVVSSVNTARLQTVQRMVALSINLNGYARVALSGLLGLILVMTMFSSAFPQEPTDPANEVERLISIAKTAQEEGHYDDAIRAYRQVVALSKESPKNAALAYFNAGILYLQFKKYDDAVNAFQQSILLEPNSAEANNNLGMALGSLKQYSRAAAAFQRAIALDRNLLIAHFNVGLMYSQMGQLKYAEFVYKILIRDHPEYAAGYDGMAVILSKSGRAREAIPLHQKAISLDTDNPSFYYNLGISYLVLDNTGKALEQKEKLLQLDPLAANSLAILIAKHQK
jgi:tetratricopeptide (TPR) repeat protein